MSKGLLAGDNIAMGMEQAFAGIRAEADSRAELARAKAMADRLERAHADNAANLAEKHALRKALAQIDPNHPLIVNKALQEKIQAAGERALVMTNNFNAVREAGESFKY